MNDFTTPDDEPDDGHGCHLREEKSCLSEGESIGLNWNTVRGRREINVPKWFLRTDGEMAESCSHSQVLFPEIPLTAHGFSKAFAVARRSQTV
jgi:hypothetical protein